jgi:hypothetical protein
MVGQGLTDNLVLPTEQEKWVAARCAGGQRLEYRTYQGFDHVGLVVDPESPLPAHLVAWTQDRFDRKPEKAGCETVEG